MRLSSAVPAASVLLLAAPAVAQYNPVNLSSLGYPDTYTPGYGAACNFQVGSPVRTTSGLVYGHRAPNATQVSEYLGIPFAQPPVGDLRFAPPVAYNSSADFNATSFGHICPQQLADVPFFLTPNVYNLLSQLGGVGQDPSEDCLTMNVWSKPQSGEALKPVLVWIYGGGFNTGGTNTSAYSGQYWANGEDVVFVSFNYRLNIFGFPGAPGITQNVGLLDQRLAIEWVRDNIAGFGGDPSRITIFGQSAGGASVDYYNYAYPTDPIIAGSILQSGTAASFGNREPANAARSWYDAAAAAGCPNSTYPTPDLVLACMRSPAVTTAQLTAAINPGTGLAAVLGHFGPTIDGATVFENYTARNLAGMYAQRPAVVGNNDYEAGLFELIEAGAGVTLSEDTWLYFDLGVFTCPASAAAGLRAQAGLPVWRYRYFGMYPNLELPTGTGKAWHGAELLPLFGTSQEVTKTDSTWEERAVGDYLRGAWSAFARCPESGLAGYGWPLYKRGEATEVLIGMGNDTVPSFAKPEVYDTTCGSFPYGGAANEP